MLDATVIGVVFQKLANANARANTVIFSDTALLEVEDGRAYLRFRVADMSWRPLSQATMQLGCFRYTSSGPLRSSRSSDAPMFVERTPRQLNLHQDGVPLPECYLQKGGARACSYLCITY